MERSARLRRRVAALGPRGRGSRIPDGLRSEITTYARERQAYGAGLKQTSSPANPAAARAAEPPYP